MSAPYTVTFIKENTPVSEPTRGPGTLAYGFDERQVLMSIAFCINDGNITMPKIDFDAIRIETSGAHFTFTKNELLQALIEDQAIISGDDPSAELHEPLDNDKS